MRAITLNADGLLAVDASGGFTTTDPVLADEVARRLDREDPLPCPHAGDWFDVSTLGDGPGSVWLCGDCGEMRRGGRPE